ncbi:MAG: ABC transporter permease [Bernardetiaceae bacterium]
MTNKILLIIAREYLTRVRKRSFLIASLLAPLLIGSIIVVPIWLSTLKGSEKVIGVLSELSELEQGWPELESIVWQPLTGTLEEARSNLDADAYYAVLYIPADFSAQLYTKESVSLEVKRQVERSLQQKAEAMRLIKLGIESQTLAEVKSKVKVSIKRNQDSDANSSPEAASGVGYFASMLIYFFIFFFGAQVMRGVVEEKSSRIVEVIISSVRPFELMMGKIIGIGGVALTQFLIWAVLIIALQTALSWFISPEAIASANSEAAQTSTQIQGTLSALYTLNLPLIFGMLIFYFLTAYLFYGALFAMVGAVSDTDTDSQQLTLPISMPLIVSIMIAVYVIREPQSTLAVWSSLIPFTAPVVMMTRLPFGVPTWQLLLSMTIMVGSFLGATWAAAKIYRIGILMYGKKVSYKDLWRWLKN